MLQLAPGWVLAHRRMIMAADSSPNGLSHSETRLILANVA
jgi:hypothetical protein